MPGPHTLLQLSSNPDLFTLEWLKSHGVRIGLLLLLAVVVTWGGSVAVRRFRRRLEGSAGATVQISLYRTATLASTTAYVLRVAVWTVVLLMILGEIGFNLGPLLAGAGIAGVAIGFGAQSLVRDFLAGFFILLENQFGVGESVALGVVGGTLDGRVEALTLRTTAVRTEDGTVSVVPNGNIQVVSNRSRGVGDLVVEVSVPGALDDEGVEGVERELDRLVGELQSDPEMTRRLASGPTALGIELTEDGRTLVRVGATTRPSRRAEVEQQIRDRVTQQFAWRGRTGGAARDGADGQG